MYRILAKIKLNKVEDRDMRNALLGDHLKIFRIAKEHDEYATSLQAQFEPGAIKEANEAYQKYAEEQVEIDLEKIDREAFADVIAKGDIDLTLGETALLGPLFKEDQP